jgi:hypothetical protein
MDRQALADLAARATSRAAPAVVDHTLEWGALEANLAYCIKEVRFDRVHVPNRHTRPCQPHQLPHHNFAVDSPPTLPFHKDVLCPLSLRDRAFG